MVDVTMSLEVELELNPTGVGIVILEKDDTVQTFQIDWPDLLDTVISEDLYDEGPLDALDHARLCFIASGLNKASKRVLDFVRSRPAF